LSKNNYYYYYYYQVAESFGYIMIVDKQNCICTVIKTKQKIVYVLDGTG